jgi:hypothetical protein
MESRVKESWEPGVSGINGSGVRSHGVKMESKSQGGVKESKSQRVTESRVKESWEPGVMGARSQGSQGSQESHGSPESKSHGSQESVESTVQGVRSHGVKMESKSPRVKAESKSHRVKSHRSHRRRGSCGGRGSV